MPSLLTQSELAAFNTNGFVIVRAMFDREETGLLRDAMERDPEVSGHILDRLDANGAATASHCGTAPATAFTGWPRGAPGWWIRWSRSSKARSIIFSRS